MKRGRDDSRHNGSERSGGGRIEPAHRDRGDNKRTKQGIAAPASQMRILIPSKCAGGVIGKGGETIRRLRSDYNATVNVPDSHAPERIVVVGAALDGMLGVLRDSLPKLSEGNREASDKREARILVHQSHAGAIIGKQGAKIKELKQNTGAHIKIFGQCLPLSTERCMLVTGSDDQIVDAVKAIFEIINEVPLKGQVEEYDTVNYDPMAVEECGCMPPPGGGGNMHGGSQRGPRGGTGGPGGNYGSQMHGAPYGDGARGGGGGAYGGGRQQQGGYAPPSAGGYGSGGGPPSYGGPPQDPRGAYGGAAGGYGAPPPQAGQGYGGGGAAVDPWAHPPAGVASGGGRGPPPSQVPPPQAPVPPPQHQALGGAAAAPGAVPDFGTRGGPVTRTQVTIPNELAGTIIGKGGETINRIRQEAGASITVEPGVQLGTERIITIMGDQVAIQTAQYLLQQWWVTPPTRYPLDAPPPPKKKNQLDEC